MNGQGDDDVRRLPWISWGSCFAVAYALKAGYSRASAEDLGWILAPTARLVGALRGEWLVAGLAGWSPPDGFYVIAPACAGVNFLILAFVVSVLGFSHTFRTPRGRMLFGLGALGGAWAITLGVNAVRILGAIELYRVEPPAGWTREELHRLLGVVVYLGALSGLFAALDRLTAKRQATSQTPAAMLLLVPGAYLGMTLGVPLLTGAFREQGGRFARHAIMVSLAALAAFVAALLVRRFGANREGRP